MKTPRMMLKVLKSRAEIDFTGGVCFCFFASSLAPSSSQMANQAAVLTGTHERNFYFLFVTTLTASFLIGLNKFSIEERPHPKPGPNQVVIQMKSVGICGSDVHYYHHGSCGIFKVNGPIVLGKYSFL